MSAAHEERLSVALRHHHRAGALFRAAAWDYVGVPGFPDFFRIGPLIIPVTIFMHRRHEQCRQPDRWAGQPGRQHQQRGLCLLRHHRLSAEPGLSGAFCFTVVGALLAFLWYNAHPAELFMGDTGSLALGATLALVAVMTGQWLLLPVIGFVFVAEARSVIIQVGYFKLTRRMYGEGRRVFKMAPLHHHFELLGWSEMQVKERFWLVAVLAACWVWRWRWSSGVIDRAACCDGDHAIAGTVGIDELQMPSFAGKRHRHSGPGTPGAGAGALLCGAPGAHVTVSDAAPGRPLAHGAGRAGRPAGGTGAGRPPAAAAGWLRPALPERRRAAANRFVQAAIARGIPLSNDSLLTLQLARQRGLGRSSPSPGSSGKTTTTTLVGEMLAASGRTVHVGGNIGTPLLDRLDAIAPGDRIVLELSSFPAGAVRPGLGLRAFWPPGAGCGGHPQRDAQSSGPPSAHGGLCHRQVQPVAPPAVRGRGGPQRRRRGDRSLARAAPAASAVRRPSRQSGSLAPAGRRSPPACRRRVRRSSRSAARRRWPPAPGWMATCSSATVSPSASAVRCKLRGDHNVSNLLAAAAISGAAGARRRAWRDVARTFAGVPHRLEVVAEAGGVTWINDSIATSPERAMAGLRSFAARRADR